MVTERAVYVAGHRGMVGSALVSKLQTRAAGNILTADRNELDLLNQAAVDAFFASHDIGQVYIAAAKVGGIFANNTYPADFIYQNLVIETNLINAAYRHGVDRLLFLGSSCIYPKLAEQPIAESALLTGPLEPTNEAYAIAKIAGIKLCEGYNRQHGCDYRSVMPTNLYGPNDNFHPENSHVLPALIKRMHEATVRDDPEVTIWGSGTPRREFLHVDDMAAACLHVMDLPRETYENTTEATLSHINVGTGSDCSIRELAETIAGVVGYQGTLQFDTSKPDGTPRKLLDVSRLTGLGWRSSIALSEGIQDTYRWYLAHAEQARV